MRKNEIIKFAKSQGYDGVAPLGKWRDYDAYEPVINDTNEENPAIVGPPLIILVRGDEIRMSTEDEAYQQLEESES